MGDEEEMNMDFGGDAEGGEGGEGGGSNPCISCCIGLVLFPAALAFLAWNEVNSVCTGKSIKYAVSRAVTQDCDKLPAAGDPLYFSCEAKNLPNWTVEDLGQNITGVPSWEALGAASEAMFYGCEESKTSNRRRSTGFKYSYSKAWRPVNGYTKPEQCDRAKKAENCGPQACDMPTGQFGDDATVWGSGITAGIFPVDEDLLRSALGLESEVVHEEYSVPSCKDNPAVGCEKVTLSSRTAKFLSYLGAAADAIGSLKDIEVPASWGCEAGTYSQLVGSREGKTKEETGEYLQSINSTLAWIFRLAGVAFAVMGIYACLSPIASAAEAMGDLLSNIPCLGDFLADAIEGVVGFVLCGISIGIGCGCSLLVIGVMQLYLNPLIGASLIGVAICCCIGMVALRKSQGAPNKRIRKDQQDNMEMPNPAYGAASPYQMPQGYPAPMQQPMVQANMMQPAQPQQYTVMVPEGAGPGMLVPFMTADGRQMTAAVPDGFGPGMAFQVLA